MNDLTLQILQRLRQADGFLSGGEICREFSMTRSAVWKHIGLLREQGYLVEAVTGRGYRLTATPDLPCDAEVQSFLETRRIGRDLTFHETAVSTNLLAKVMARSGVPEGTAVSADEQTGGRGRMLRRWVSPAGVNLYFSLILRPAVSPGRIPQIPLLAAAAVHRSLSASVPELDFRIKWPNDILVGGKKICGILCEMESEADIAHFVIVGIGINVNLCEMPEEISDIATSLCLAAGRRYSRARLLASFFNSFEPLYDAWLEGEDLAPVLPVLETHSYLLGRTIEVEQFNHRLRGIAVGISPAGELLLEMDNGERKAVSSGEAHLSVE